MESFDKIKNLVMRRINKKCPLLASKIESYFVGKKSLNFILGYRDLCLLDCIKDLIPAKRFNKELIDIYKWTELHVKKCKTHLLLRLFNKSKKKLVMNKKDFNEYLAWKDSIIVFRGCANTHISIYRPSWTINIHIASGTARRMANGIKKNMYIYRAKIKKKDIYCYVTSQAEKEVILNPYKFLELPERIKIIKPIVEPSWFKQTIKK